MKTVRILIRCGSCGANIILDVAIRHSGSVNCPSCQTVAFAYQEIRGFIYILSNERMPGLLKIGFTTRSVANRVSELNCATGVPAPFQIEAWFASVDAVTAEQVVHDRLGIFRVKNKEFFEVDLSVALNILEAVFGCGPGFCRNDPRPRIDTDKPTELVCPKCKTRNLFSNFRYEQNARCGNCKELLLAAKKQSLIYRSHDVE